MNISIVIVVCDRGRRLAECIQSVLDQSYPAHEIILVDTLGDDGYVKGTISQIDRANVKCIFHPVSKTYSSAIDEGYRASNGEVVCFLDSNDRFGKEKLNEVAAYFGENPNENAACHAYFVVSRHGRVLSLWRPTGKVTLEDLLLREKLPFSALAIRGSSFRELTIYRESLTVDANWMGFVGRLLLANIALGVIDRPLCECRAVDNFAGKSLTVSLESFSRVLEAIFNDPRCPEKALGLREAAMARIRLKLAYEAFVRGEGALGREMLRASIHLDRSILDVQAYRFFFFLNIESIRDGDDHHSRINSVFDQLPPEMMWMMPHRNEVIARGSALRGVRAVLWGRYEEGAADLAEALRLGCRIDQYFFYALAAELMDCEAVSGHTVVDSAVGVLTPYLETMSTPSFVRRFKGEYFANRAFREFDNGRYSIALRSIQHAMFVRPVFLTNRGLLATLFRSLERLRYQTV